MRTIWACFCGRTLDGDGCCPASFANDVAAGTSPTVIAAAWNAERGRTTATGMTGPRVREIVGYYREADLLALTVCYDVADEGAPPPAGSDAEAVAEYRRLYAELLAEVESGTAPDLLFTQCHDARQRLLKLDRALVDTIEAEATAAQAEARTTTPTLTTTN